MKNRLERVHVASLRVALMASAVFAVVYAVIATIIVMVVTGNLTSQIDNRLASSISAAQAGTLNPRSLFGDPNGSLGAPRQYAWLVATDGSVAWTNTNLQVLPAATVALSNPTTQTLAGAELRIDAAPIEGGRVVIAQSIDSVSQTRSAISVTETIVGLVLLAVAFVGALIGGRRVGAPIELARQRQMEFTADASHELRTPLSVIEAQTSLALAQDRDPAWYRTAFQRVGNESRRIRRLVEDLLWLARVDAEPAQSHGEAVEVGVLANQTVDRFTAVAESRRLRLTFDVSDEPHMVAGSPEWLDRLLGVLIDNACKYTPEGGSVRVSVVNDGNRVRVAVEDSGPGIPAEERPRIFERFHRATGSHSGAGLGLAIADAVVRRTHGRWEVGTSSLLGGASLAVSWPRAGGGSRETARPPEPVAAADPRVAAPAPPPV